MEQALTKWYDIDGKAFGALTGLMTRIDLCDNSKLEFIITIISHVFISLPAVFSSIEHIKNLGL